MSFLISRYSGEDGKTDLCDERGPYNYVRARRVREKDHIVDIERNLAEIATLNDSSLCWPIIPTCVHFTDGRPLNGRLTHMGGIWLYERDLVIIRGVLTYRNKEYPGFDLLGAHTKDEMVDRTKDFLKRVCNLSSNLDLDDYLIK